MSDYSDIQQELDDFENAVYGEEVRDSMVSAIKKIHDLAESAAGAPNATTATAGQAPIADGAGGWQWGDVVTSGDTVPTEVRQAIFNLLNNNAFANDDTYTADLAVLEAWASVATAISVTPSTASISGSSTQQLTAVTTPSGASVSWASSDTSVATISSSGLVTGVGNGTCTITAMSGNVSSTCTVTVTGFANLTSINAVYTQSGTVYDTDTLDSLRDDLVVTASYNDSSTQTVTDYTLSGTLTEGTSTVTVAYGGMTTTFTVTVSSLVRTYALEGNDKGFNEASSIGTSFEGTKKTTAARFRTPNAVPVSNGDILSLSWNAEADPSDMRMYLLYYDADQNYASHRSAWTNSNVWTHNVDYPYVGIAVKSNSGQYITDEGRTITLTVSSGT